MWEVTDLKNTNQTYTYEFAFSFAGEDRKIVEEIKNHLSDSNYSVFYDNDFQHDLVGKDLYTHLRNIYRDNCKYVVCFISENYSKKIWTNLEFTAVKERLMSTFFSADFLIPIIIDDSKLLDDIPSFLGFYKHETVEKTAKILIEKFETSLIEDNYIRNVDNCIEHLCDVLSKKLTHHGYLIQVENNSIVCRNTGMRFKFMPEENMNIPCILVFFMEETTPSIFISWINENVLRFNVHYFDNIKKPLTDQSLNNVINLLEEYITIRIR